MLVKPSPTHELLKYMYDENSCRSVSERLIENRPTFVGEAAKQLIGYETNRYASALRSMAGEGLVWYDLVGRESRVYHLTRKGRDKAARLISRLMTV